MIRWTTICFDLDNTLYSHEQAFERAILYCYKKFSSHWPIKVDADLWFTEFKKNCDIYWDLYENKSVTGIEYRRLRYQATLNHFSIPYNNEEADNFHRMYYDIIDDFSEPFPELISLLSALKDAQITIGIITNGKSDVQKNKIAKLAIEAYISPKNIFVSDDIKFAKPDKRIFDYALLYLSKDRKKPLFIGDSWEHDIVGALEAGWDAIYLNSRQKEPSTNHIPISCYHTLKEVADIIYKENQLKG